MISLQNIHVHYALSGFNDHFFYILMYNQKQRISYYMFGSLADSKILVGNIFLYYASMYGESGFMKFHNLQASFFS